MIGAFLNGEKYLIAYRMKEHKGNLKNDKKAVCFKSKLPFG
jgi:hypothetical protein